MTKQISELDRRVKPICDSIASNLQWWGTPLPIHPPGYAHAVTRGVAGVVLLVLAYLYFRASTPNTGSLAIPAAMFAAAFASFYTCFDEIPRTNGTVFLKTVYAAFAIPLVTVMIPFEQEKKPSPPSSENAPLNASTTNLTPTIVYFLPLPLFLPSSPHCLEYQQVNSLSDEQIKTVLASRSSRPPSTLLPSYSCPYAPKLHP
jgi:hypothetical protein